jgi:hypothetical protein
VEHGSSIDDDVPEMRTVSQDVKCNAVRRAQHAFLGSQAERHSESQ